MDVLTNLDDYAGWLAAVTAGLVAAGWLLRRLRTGLRIARETIRKIDVLEELASLELTPNGGGSIKDRVGQVPTLLTRVAAVEQLLGDHLRACQPSTTVVVNNPGEHP